MHFVYLGYIGYMVDHNHYVRVMVKYSQYNNINNWCLGKPESIRLWLIWYTSLGKHIWICRDEYVSYIIDGNMETRSIVYDMLHVKLKSFTNLSNVLLSNIHIMLSSTFNAFCTLQVQHLLPYKVSLIKKNLPSPTTNLIFFIRKKLRAMCFTSSQVYRLVIARQGRSSFFL